MATNIYIYKHTSNLWESNHRDGPTGHKKGGEKRESFEYITTIIETHWILSCNCKDKIMNKEARTIANI